MMGSLTNDQFEFLHFYYNLLNTIEEGFEYVIDSFTNLDLTDADQVFKDILAAFYHVDSSNDMLLSLLTEEENDLVQDVKTFDQVILTLDDESTIFLTPDKHEAFVRNQLAPVYLAWKEKIQSKLQPYIVH
jgi:hypothetical protein